MSAILALLNPPTVTPRGGRIHRLLDEELDSQKPAKRKYTWVNKPYLDRSKDAEIVLAALQACDASRKRTRTSIEKIVGFSKPRTVEALHKLSEQGLIEWTREGSPQFGQWRVL